MGNVLKYTLSSLLALSLVACGSDDESPKAPANDNQKEQTETSDENGTTQENDNSVTYNRELTPMVTGEDIKVVKFSVPKAIQRDQKMVLSYNFNSKGATKFEVLRQTIQGCQNMGKITKQLVRTKDDKVVAEEVAPGLTIRIQENTDYAYQVIREPGAQCESMTVTMEPWLGDYSHDPVLVRTCLLKTGQTNTNFLYAPRLTPLLARKTGHMFMGPNTMCGEQIERASGTGSVDHANQSASGEVEAANGAVYTFDISFGEDEKTGQITCLKNGQEVMSGQLVRCQDKIMDLRSL